MRRDKAKKHPMYYPCQRRESEAEEGPLKAKCCLTAEISVGIIVSGFILQHSGCGRRPRRC